MNKGFGMKRSRRFKILWTIWMTGGGIAVGVIVYLVTASVGWTILGLLLSSVVLNAIGQSVTQPVKAVRRSGREAEASGGPR